MKKLIGGLLACISMCAFPALAQDGGIPKDVVQGLADDLAGLQKTVAGTTSPIYLKPHVAVVTGRANVREKASLDAPVTFVAEQGQKFPIVAEKSGWYAVQWGGGDLGWMSKSVAKPILAYSAGNGDSSVYRVIVEQVSAMKQKYLNNPYVTVSGFDINIGVPPSVSVSFAFKS